MIEESSPVSPSQIQTTSFSVGVQFAGLIGWLVLSFITAAIGAFASINARTFYAGLTRPSWAPPGWLFGPVWTLLYTLMAISVWLIWRRTGFAAARKAMTLFFAQLVANGLWSWLFFAWQKGALSFVEICILWVLILATIQEFWKFNRLAATLLIPYLLWVTFAGALNFVLWRMNLLTL